MVLSVCPWWPSPACRPTSTSWPGPQSPSRTLPRPSPLFPSQEEDWARLWDTPSSRSVSTLQVSLVWLTSNNSVEDTWQKYNEILKPLKVFDFWLIIHFFILNFLWLNKIQYSTVLWAALPLGRTDHFVFYSVLFSEDRQSVTDQESFIIHHSWEEARGEILLQTLLFLTM